MSAIGSTDQRRRFLAMAVATPREKRLAAAIAVISLLAFLAFLPFVRVPLAQIPSFIPAYEAALFFIDLITALLLFEQFVRLRSAAVLVLASGYLFDALIMVPHALSFPGAFSASGLLGSGPQTTAWLYVIWHGGFPLFVIAYALLRRREAVVGEIEVRMPPARAIALVALALLLLVTLFTLLVTRGHDSLPVVMQGSDYSMLTTKGISPAVWLLTLIAMAMLWQKPQRVVDLWLMLVMWVWLFDIGLSAVVGSHRYDLGFYAGRIFGLIAASFLLMTLLVEMARLYARALGAVSSAESQVIELMRARNPADLPRNLEHTDAFVLRQNIVHYQSLLAGGGLTDSRRRAIEKLLTEEEARLRGKDAP